MTAGKTAVPRAQHQAFLAHMAELSAAFWNWSDDIGLTTMAQRLRFFAPDNTAGELTADDVPGPIAGSGVGRHGRPQHAALAVPVCSGRAAGRPSQDLLAGPRGSRGRICRPGPQQPTAATPLSELMSRVEGVSN